MARNILVVDDEAAIRNLLVEGFDGAGYHTLAAQSAEEARELMRGAPIHVAFLDLKLPGMDGLALGREIRRQNPFACLHAITGFVSLFELTECRQAGFDDYFVKPVRLKVLLRAAEVAFDKLSRWRIA